MLPRDPALRAVVLIVAIMSFTVIAVAVVMVGGVIGVDAPWGSILIGAN